MNLFKVIGHSSGENLSSAVLRYLLLRSLPIRTALLNLLSDESPGEPIYAEEQFAVFLEVSTTERDEESKEEKRGCVDILLECDSAVIGIENKFNADFQEDQPKKYFQTVDKRARDLSISRGSAGNATMRPLLFVLAPEQRREHVKQKIQEQNLSDYCAFISWQAALNALDKSKDTDPINSFLLHELKDYVSEHVDFPPDIGRLLPHLERPFTPKGSDLHVRMIDLLWPVFGSGLQETYFRSRSSGYCGYYFGPLSYPKKCWYGFINRRFVDDGDREGSAFIVASEVSGVDVKGMQPAEVQGWNKWGWRCWEVPYDHTWIERSKWEKAVAPFNQAVAEVCDADGSVA